jgi:hypothetical protein
MISEELMVGDWVDCSMKKIEGFTFDNQPILSSVVYSKILGINCTNYVFLIETEGERRLVSENQIKNIKLTEEILYKNGFPKDNIGFGHFEEDKDLILELSIIGTQIWWTIGDNEYRLLRLQYVHELQHALKLCRIDKEIVL